MKTRLRFILGTLIPFLLLIQCEKEIPVANLNEPYFTIVDTAFFYALISQGIDVNNDGKISQSEAETVTSLDVSGSTTNGRRCTDSTEVSDYTGIEAFVNLRTLNCLCGDAVSLDLSGNTQLRFVDCSLNKLTHLDVSGCLELRELWCTTNSLPELDISQNKALMILGCVNNNLTSLDVSNNTILFELNCGLNPITELDVSNLNFLTNLYCVQNYLTDLDLSNNPDLFYLNFRNNDLSSLDLSSNTYLKYINGNGNSLIQLDISNNTMLSQVYLRDMPSLQEVFVWELPFPPEGMEMDTTGSPNIKFYLQ